MTSLRSGVKMGLMKKNKTTTLELRFLVVGDKKVISKVDNQKIFKNYPKSILLFQKIKNIGIACVYSTVDVEFGAIECTIYPKGKKKKKPTTFYYITTNSLNHIKLEILFKEIDNYGVKTGEIKIETGKICFQPLGPSKNKRSDINKSGTLDKKVEENLIKEFKKWNNTFIYDAENGIYEIFQYDFNIKEDPNLNNYDTMFSVKKK